MVTLKTSLKRKLMFRTELAVRGGDRNTVHEQGSEVFRPVEASEGSGHLDTFLY